MTPLDAALGEAGLLGLVSATSVGGRECNCATRASQVVSRIARGQAAVLQLKRDMASGDGSRLARLGFEQDEAARLADLHSRERRSNYRGGTAAAAAAPAQGQSRATKTRTANLDGYPTF